MVKMQSELLFLSALISKSRLSVLKNSRPPLAGSTLRNKLSLAVLGCKKFQIH